MAQFIVHGVQDIGDVTFNTPPWVRQAGENLYIFAGVELLAFYLVAEDQWYVKDGRCNWCGACCADIGTTHPDHPFPVVGDECIHAADIGRGSGFPAVRRQCLIGWMRPLACSIKPEPHDISNYPTCSITYIQGIPSGDDLEITIPEWAKKRPIWLIVGRELFGSYDPTYGGWNYKKKRCNQCGDCCKGITSEMHPYPVVGGACVHLDGNNECSLGLNCSLFCCLDPAGEPNCNITRVGMV